MTHGEVYAESSYAMLRAGGEVPGIAQDVKLPGRPRTTHLLPSRRTIEAGEPFAVDVAGVYKPGAKIVLDAPSAACRSSRRSRPSR